MIKLTRLAAATALAATSDGAEYLAVFQSEILKHVYILYLLWVSYALNAAICYMKPNS